MLFMFESDGSVVVPDGPLVVPDGLVFEFVLFMSDVPVFVERERPRVW